MPFHVEEMSSVSVVTRESGTCGGTVGRTEWVVGVV